MSDEFNCIKNDSLGCEAGDKAKQTIASQAASGGEWT